MTTLLQPELGTRPTTPCREWQGRCTGRGYARVWLDGRMVDLHRWVVETVEGVPLAPGEIVLHRCDNPPCYRYDHLRRGTLSDNHRDAVLKGRWHPPHHYGEANGGGGKLTARQVRMIRRLHRPGHGGNTGRLAERFGVSRSLISRISKGVSWPHLQ